MYETYAPVFHGVLKNTGPWPLDDGMDLLHDFVVEQLPRALGSYDENRGERGAWLYTVFYRYALRRRGRGWKARERVALLETDTDEELSTDHADLELGGSLENLWSTVDELPGEEGQLLAEFLGTEKGRKSVRVIAAEREESRYKVQEGIVRAIALLMTQLEGQEVLTTSEERAIRPYLLGRSTKSIAAELSVPESAVKSDCRSAIIKARSVFTHVARRKKGLR